MSNYNIRNAAPRAILRGIKDESGRPPVYEPDLIPTHLPHLFVFAERGDTLPQFVSGDSMTRFFGKNTFDYRKKYANHQTVIANTVNAEGNKMMVQRIVPPGANPPATLRLSVDVICDDLPVYERAIDGSYKLDELGELIPTGDLVAGYKYRWIVGPTIDLDDDGRLMEDGDPRKLESGVDRILESSIGEGPVAVGEMTNTDGDQSTIYPIMDFKVTHFGDYGNRIGVRFSAPTTETPFAVDDQTIEEQLAYLFRLQFVERDEATSTAKVLETLFGEQFVDFTFKDGVIDVRTEKELTLEKAVVPAFYQEAAAGMDEILPPIDEIYVYRENLELLLQNAYDKELPHGTVLEGEEAFHLMNIFSGKTYTNIPYETVRIAGPAEGGVLLTDTTTHYCMGGFDGFMDFNTFDEAVRYQLLNYGDLEAKVLDSAYYPQSVVYDSGFTLETKKAMFTPMGRRKDMYCVISTQDVSQRQNTPSEETSIAIALRTAARMYPESEVYGTPTCRAIVIGHSGYLLNTNYYQLLPLTVEFAQKSARYMGAGTAVWKTNARFDAPPNNHVKMFKGVNADWLSVNARGRQWDAGLVWVQNYDRRSLFYPAVQTVYDDDSSVLNAAANMIIAVELEKIAERTWRDLTGISYLTPGQFIERSNRLIEEGARGRFDNRAIIVPETFYTENDEQRGYSWSCNIHMYTPNMKTVGTFTIVAHRIEDYTGGE